MSEDDAHAPTDRVLDDLAATLSERRGFAGDDVAADLLDRESHVVRLVGLTDDCRTAVLYHLATYRLYFHPVTTERLDAITDVDSEQFGPAGELAAFVHEESWDWLHPRYRWAASAEGRPPSEDGCTGRA